MDSEHMENEIVADIDNSDLEFKWKFVSILFH